MKQLLSRLPKKALIVASTLVATFGIAAVAHAYYPDRPTYTNANPADHVTFNSITDNPNEGDERSFFQVKDSTNTTEGGFAHTATVHDGEELTLRMYVHNDAADNLNTVSDGNGGYKGVATNTQVRVFLPTVTDNVERLNAYVSADNAAPQVVSDSLDLASAVSNQKFSLSYEPGTAVGYNNQDPSGLPLSDSIVTTGAKIGESQADGVIPGCYQYANIVTLKVKVHLTTPSFSMSKTVALPGDKSWSKTVNAQASQTVKYEINFKNTGNAELDNVQVRDELPKGITYVAGSTKIYNSNYPNGVAAQDDNLTKNGINIGAYVPLDAATLADSTRQSAQVDFEATTPSNDALTCGDNKLTNLAQVTVNGQDETDTADVHVTKTCAATPTFTCDNNAFAVTQTSTGRNVTISGFSAPVTNGATFKDVSINWGDNSAVTLTNTPVGQTHQYTADGNYTINTTLNFTVNGVNQTPVTGVCTKTVSFTSGTPSTPPTTTTIVTTAATAPTTLVNTGPGQIIGLFATVAVAGSVAYRLFLGRRLNSNK